MKTPPKTVTICVYGTRNYGYYCLASIVVPGRMLGTIYGKAPADGGVRYQSPTEALWTIQQEILVAGIPGESPVEIHCEFGDVAMIAKAEMSYIPTFGSLVWSQGITVDAEEVQNKPRAEVN